MGDVEQAQGSSQSPTEVLSNIHFEAEMLKIFRNVKRKGTGRLNKEVLMNSVVLTEVSPGKCIRLRHLRTSRTSSGWIYGVFVLNLISLIILIIKNVLLKQVVIS